jgi:hypothetical protein
LIAIVRLLRFYYGPTHKIPHSPDIPAEYNWLPASDLPSAVLELANLYVAFARDLAAGTQTAPTFDDAVWMHRLIELFETSSRTGGRVAVT